MNIRNLLLAASLAVASGAAFAGKSPTTLGGFQSVGSSVVPGNIAAAVDAAGKGQDAQEEKQKENTPPAPRAPR